MPRRSLVRAAKDSPGYFAIRRISAAASRTMGSRARFPVSPRFRNRPADAPNACCARYRASALASQQRRPARSRSRRRQTGHGALATRRRGSPACAPGFRRLRADRCGGRPEAMIDFAWRVPPQAERQTQLQLVNGERLPRDFAHRRCLPPTSNDIHLPVVRTDRGATRLLQRRDSADV